MFKGTLKTINLSRHIFLFYNLINLVNNVDKYIKIFKDEKIAEKKI